MEFLTLYLVYRPPPDMLPKCSCYNSCCWDNHCPAAATCLPDTNPSCYSFQIASAKSFLVATLPGSKAGFLKRFSLFIFREWKGERKRGRETSMCGCLSCTPYRGPGLQPRHVPQLGMEPATLWFSASPPCTEPHQPGHKAGFNIPIVYIFKNWGSKNWSVQDPKWLTNKL